MSLFQILLDAARASNATGAERVNELADALRTNKGVDFKALLEAAKASSAELKLDGEDPEALANLEILADVAEATSLVRTELTQAESARKERVDGLSKRLADATSTPGHEGDGENGGSSPSNQSDSGPVDSSAPDAAADTSADLVPIAASGDWVKVELGGLPSTLPARVKSRSTQFELRAAADVPNFASEQELDDFQQLVAAATSKIVAMGRKDSTQRQQGGIATLRRIGDPDITPTNENDWGAVWRANDETRLQGGSLLTAGAWCAPAERLWGFCPVPPPSTVIDLPWVNVPRGEIRWPKTPDVSSLYCGEQSGIGWCALLPEYNSDGTIKSVKNSNGDAATWNTSNKQWEIDSTPVLVLDRGNTYNGALNSAGLVEKPCFEIPCPEGDEVCTLQPCGVCIKTGLLLNRAWPEMVDWYLQQSLRAYQHIMNARYLARLVKMATELKITPALPPTVETEATAVYPKDGLNHVVSAAATQAYGPGATATVLSIVELQVTYLRLKYRLGNNATIEMIAPNWLHGVIRSDLSKRRGTAWLSVSDAEINRLFTDRGVRVQWVTDWQDAATGIDGQCDPSGLGGSTPPKTWPGVVNLLFYPAGAIFAGRSDIITIDGVVDSVLLAQNKRIAFFFEEAWCLQKKCYELVNVQVPICPNGAVGASETLACPSA